MDKVNRKDVAQVNEQLRSDGRRWGVMGLGTNPGLRKSKKRQWGLRVVSFLKISQLLNNASLEDT